MPDLLTVFSFALGLLPEKARAIFQQKAGLNRALLALLSSEFMKEVKVRYETGLLTLVKMTQMSQSTCHWSIPHGKQPIEKHESWTMPYKEPFRIKSGAEGKGFIIADREEIELGILASLPGICTEAWVGIWAENTGFIETGVQLNQEESEDGLWSTGMVYIPSPENWGWAKEGEQLANIEVWVVVLN